MLAISATGTLTLVDPATLKRSPSSISPCLSLPQTATCSGWSHDNTSLFLASAQAIHKYEPSTNSLTDLYTPKEAPISHLISKDKATVIYSAGAKVHLLESGSSAKITQTFESHKSLITSLSLSNDLTLLASTSSNAVHVHNLTLGSHVVLKGLALTGQTITSSTFHPHARTRLLIGFGKQLVIYDTTKPSGPLKTIALNEASSGDIVAVACSPFSKTLVAVATSGGNVALLDLEKEKGLCRTLNLRAPLTTVVFSTEGGSLYMGTEHGKLFIIDLRALDKPAKTVVISETSCRIETMSIQRKMKASETAKPATTATLSSKPGTQARPVSKPVTKSAASPVRTRAARVGSTAASPAHRHPSATCQESLPTTKATPRKLSPSTKKVFSPVRDPLGNSAGDISVQLDTLGVTKATPVRKASISSTRSRLSLSPKVPPSISARSAISVSEEGVPTRRTRTVPTATRTRETSTESLSATDKTKLTVPATDTLQPRPRTGSSASRTGSIATSASTLSTGPALPASSASHRRVSSISRHTRTSSPPPLDRRSRTPSPELPSVNLDPMTPVPAAKRAGTRMGVLGLGTPEVDRWIRAGKAEDISKGKDKGKGKTVGFKGDSEDDDGEESDSESEAMEREREREHSLSMQVSPVRPPAAASWAPSPLRQSPAGAGAGTAHDLLRTIVKDVMYDFQQETRAEMTGLHLDLVRMGRGWKRELRELMEEYSGGMNELREENRRLREENERLRRGF
ncbi:hypothetical protein H0H81_012469 [Sphagnurus paluster]|uniref:WD40 repeat-like protein n=1 Tax=Sphagnurus paluster TaxID=117069 RepID=A0A9P7GNU9_9AGAR|nr:hypothetical protein H0H81_012469 [Sphagnurus paluster]